MNAPAKVPTIAPALKKQTNSRFILNGACDMMDILLKIATSNSITVQQNCISVANKITSPVSPIFVQQKKNLST